MEGCSGGGGADEGSSGFAGLRKGRREKQKGEVSAGGDPDVEAGVHLSSNKQPSSSLVTSEQLDSELGDPERPDFLVLSCFFRCRFTSCTDEEAFSVFF